MSRASAPGKIILFGEHAVVYGRPALAVPVMQVQAVAEVTALPADPADEAGKSWQAQIRIEAPDIGLSADLQTLLAKTIPQPLAAAVMGVLSKLGIGRPTPMLIRISSSIPVAAGLGSGAAVSTAVIRAISVFLDRPLQDEQVSALAFEVEKIHHGTPSGIDNTVIAHAAPVFFVKGEPLQVFHAAKPFTIVIADTGIAAPTRTSVADVRRLWEAERETWDKVFDRIGEIARHARAEIERGEPAAMGPLMDENHALLQILTVSSPELDKLVLAARSAGAQGAKLSGGGRGGNMIALAGEENAPAIAEALVEAGAKRTIITRIG